MARSSASSRRALDSALPANFDPWEPVPYDDLPPELVRAFHSTDWDSVRGQLRTLMDGITTDGPYGRQLIQLVRQLPLGINALFDRYRAVTAIDYGDWDDLHECLGMQPDGQAEIEGVRDIWLAPPDHTGLPSSNHPHQLALFEMHELQLQRNWRRYRQWAQENLGHQFADIIWNRQYVPVVRHLLYRRLQDVVFLAIAEANGGRLSAAAALAREGQRLGRESEQLRIAAADVEQLAIAAAGRILRPIVRFPRQVATPIGYSPLGSWEVLSPLLPLLTLGDLNEFSWTASTVERISSRLSSPRAQLQAQSWLVAADLLTEKDPSNTDLDGLLLVSRPAVPGLRVVPQLLDGFARHRYAAFAQALALARSAGNVWAQVSALTWMTSLNPNPWSNRSLHRLLEVTGWRRPILVPPQIAADAALGLATAGIRSRSVVELAQVAGRHNVIVEVASRHLDDERAPLAARTAAVHALAKLGTSRSRELLERVGRRRDELGMFARSVGSRSHSESPLTDREIEVVGLAAKGLTNKEIAAQLGLSEHTIARHIGNSLGKLGAANRAEAVSRLAELSRATT